MSYNHLIQSILSGRSLFFLGAGFSLGVENIAGGELVSAPKLAQHLCAQVNVESTDNLQDAADDYINITNDIDVVIDYLTSLFKVSSVNEYHKAIVKMPWKSIYTTNYDNVIEQACLSVGKNVKSITMTSSHTNISTRLPIVLHINGFVDNLTRDTLETEFKLTNSSYATEGFLSSEWYTRFMTEIDLSDSIVFIGYSLYDIDIQKIFVSQPNLKDKTFFVLGENCDDRTKRKVSKFGTIIEKTTESFAKDLLEAQKDFTAKPSVQLMTSFQEITKDSYSVNMEKISSEDIFNLFVWGKYDKNKIYFDLTRENNEYYIVREELLECIDLIKNGNEKNIIIQSEFGNGKTLFIEGIKVLCARDEIKCYIFNQQNEKSKEEFLSILSNTSKQIVIIDSYYKYVDLLKYSTTYRPENTIFILADRSIYSEITFDKVKRILNADPYVITLDKLDKNAVLSLANTLDKNGFWQEFSYLSSQSKQKKLTDNYKSAFSNILLALLKSNDIKCRLKDIYSQLESNTTYRDIITASCILSFVNINFDLHDVMMMINTKINNRIVFDTNPAIKQLFNNNTYSLSCKSTIFAHYILQNFTNSDYIVFILDKIYLYCSTHKKCKNAYLEITRQLDLFSIIQMILPQENKLSSVKKYFDLIKKYNNNQENFHFWLQYAISMTVFEKFDLAETYFHTSYSLYEKHNKQKNRHIMLDNHYSRFLLMKLCKKCPVDNFFSLFRSADDIVQDQLINDETRHYPYRVVLLYSEFYKLYKEKMTSEEKNMFLASLKKICSKIDSLSIDLQKNKYVSEAKERLMDLIENHL